MQVIAVLVAVAACAGLLVWLAATRWPRFDVAAPRVKPETAGGAGVIRRHDRLRATLRQRVDPAAATGLLLTVAVSAVVALVVAMGLLLVMADHNAGLARWDLSFARWGADNATSTSTSWLKLVSDLGGTIGVISVALAVALVEYRRDGKRAVFAFLTLTVAGQFLVSNLIKAAVHRPRPNIHQLTGFSSSSFPSGHATAAAATFAAAALLLGRRRRRSTQTALAGIAAGMAAAVAASRVFLGVHWFTDVLAGLALGWAWFAACSIAFGGRLLEFGAPVAQAEKVASGKGTVATNPTAARS